MIRIFLFYDFSVLAADLSELWRPLAAIPAGRDRRRARVGGIAAAAAGSMPAGSLVLLLLVLLVSVADLIKNICGK